MDSTHHSLLQLISLYEEEKFNLEKSITDFLSGYEKDYLLAHYQDGALAKVNRTLHILHTLNDKSYREKQSLTRDIECIRQQLDATDNKEAKAIIIQWLEGKQNQLHQLQNLSPATEPQDQSLLYNTIARLLQNKISHVKLVLKKKDDFYLRFTYTTGRLTVSLPNVNRHLKTWLLHDENINTLQNLGFEWNPAQTKLIRSVTGDKPAILQQTMFLLTKIIFHVFYFKAFENDSYISFKEK